MIYCRINRLLCTVATYDGDSGFLYCFDFSKVSANIRFERLKDVITMPVKFIKM